MSAAERSEKRKRYQRWYYETYTKKRRATGVVKVNTYQKKTEEEKAANRKRGAEKRRQTMLERYGEEGVREIQQKCGKKLVEKMSQQPDKRYHPTSEKAREMQMASAAARTEKKMKRKRNK